MCRVTDPEKIEHVLLIAKAAFGYPQAPHLPVDNPVSLDRSNIDLLRQQEYTVSFKADGTRFVLVLSTFRGRPLATMIDRAGQVFTLFVTAQATHYASTSVFDGELCKCVDAPGSYDYLVFNALVDQGAVLRDKPYRMRLMHVANNFSGEPATVHQRQRLQSFIFAKSHRLHMIRKEHDDAKNTRAMVRSVIPRYKIDGIVLTPSNRGVRPGRDEMLLKHKSANSIDITIQVPGDVAHGEADYGLYVDNNGGLIRLADVVQVPLFFDSTNCKEFRHIQQGAAVYLRELDNQDSKYSHVVEMDCKFKKHPISGAQILHLTFVRFRPDKDGPNNADTVNRTLRTILDNVLIDEIYDILEQ